jgi:olfactory receptor
MGKDNNIQILEFLFLGISEDHRLQSIIFGLFLSIYLVTALGNLTIMLATISDSHLYTPLFFLLSNLSFNDIYFTSTTVPKMLGNIQTKGNRPMQAVSPKSCFSYCFQV